MSLLLVKNRVIRVFFVPIACLVLEITSDREWANIFKEESRYRNQDSPAVAIPSKSFASDSCRILNISFHASTRPTSEAGINEWGNQCCENFLITNSLWGISFTPGTVVRTCLAIARAVANGYF
jgi:hypothetical protein